MPTAAFAQSTGSVDFERDTIVVTGSRTQEVGGVQTPDSPKPRAVLTQEIIGRQNPGQSILDTINLVPGVSFQNNDAYGSAGGTLTVRGFDSSRVSLTFDGVPLNDTGNYALYSNQQLDPELIEQVNVNLGTTDVDSPTPSAIGGTINYRTRNPFREPGVRLLGSIGEYDYRRVFGVVDSGEFGPWGTRAFIAGSRQLNDNPFNNYGKVNKWQLNAKVYQPFGSNGDFISVAGNYNQNRNNFFGSVPLRIDLTQSPTNSAPRVVGSGSNNRFPLTTDERRYNINFPCTTVAGVAETVAQISAAGYVDQDAPNSCGTEFDRRYNPSDTGNIRVNSRFGLTDNLTLNVEPSFQYVKANGGGTATAREYGFDINPAGGATPTAVNRANCATTASNATTVNCQFGYFGGNPYVGRDLNGDGDLLDTVSVVAPNQTRTRRFGVISNLRWDINDDHTVRVNYTFDRGWHRQTGEVGLLQRDGEPEDVFPIDNALTTPNGFDLQRRNRKSLAILNQFSAEYRGEFLDNRLTVNLGVRAPFFKRDLTNYCFASSASGFVECATDPAVSGAVGAANPYVVNPTTGRVVANSFATPQNRVLKYDKLLPQVGVVYDITRQLSAFGSYAKGLQVPGTDNLYNAFYFPAGSSQGKPAPELSETIEGGLRYRSSKVQASASIWKTAFQNRLAQAYDPEVDANVYRNLGDVDKWGVEGSVAVSPVRELTLYTFGSWNKSKIKDNIALAAGANCDVPVTAANFATIRRSCALTAGNRESGAPKYTFGQSIVTNLGPVQLGLTAKRTGERFVYDDNTAVFIGDVDLTGTAGPGQIYRAELPAYWLVNADARFDLGALGQKGAYIQVNVYNLFDQLYVGGYGGGLSQSVNVGTGIFGSAPNVQIGAPRTLSASLNIEF